MQVIAFVFGLIVLFAVMFVMQSVFGENLEGCGPTSCMIIIVIIALVIIGTFIAFFFHAFSDGGGEVRPLAIMIIAVVVWAIVSELWENWKTATNSPPGVPTTSPSSSVIQANSIQPTLPLPSPLYPSYSFGQAHGPQQNLGGGLQLSLVGISGPFSGQHYPILGTVEIGRGALGIDLARDHTVSRKHAQVVELQDKVIVQDLGSSNGTYLNGVKVMSAEAHPGDLIRIGQTMFELRVSPP